MKLFKFITKPAIAAAVIFSLFTIKVSAQNDEVQLIQNLYGMQKRDIISSSLKLSAEQSPKFWELYDKYEVKRKQLGAERLNILSEYVSSYSTLTDKQANDLVMRALKNDKAFTSLQKKYYCKMRKKIGSLKAATFIQVESYLLNNIRASIQSEMPFVGDIEKMKKK